MPRYYPIRFWRDRGARERTLERLLNQAVEHRV